MSFDKKMIEHCRCYSPHIMRSAIFIVFFWFGLLKVLGISPAESLVQNLFEHTIPFVSFPTFLLFFGLLEMLIGALFLVPRATRVVIPLLFIHMCTTTLPLLLLPQVTWSAPLVPTLVGQYIIKNVVIIAAALSIAGSIEPRKTKNSSK